MLKIDLSNKLALITGATGQLGRVMADTLSDCGADIALHYNSNEQKALEIQNNILSKGVNCHIFKADITKENEVYEMANQVITKLGHPQIVINNAVIQYQWKNLLEQNIQDYYSQFESCIMQTVYTSKAFAPNMIKQKYGRIISINTECSALCETTCSAYSSAKRGLDGIIRCLAKELGEHNITVNQVAPGWTISENDRLNNTQVQNSYDNSVPLKRRGTDMEIANMVAFLASDLASFTTGAYIPVSGGRVMPSI